jgi:hypothetical protein
MASFRTFFFVVFFGCINSALVGGKKSWMDCGMDSPYGPAHESYRVITHDRTLTSVKFEWQTRLNGNPDIAERPLSLRNPHLNKYPSPLPDFLSTPSPPSSNYFLLLDPQVTNNQLHIDIHKYVESTSQIRLQVSPRPAGRPTVAFNL